MEMKAEINNENKAKFFALYWGQNLVCVAIEDADDKKGFDVTDWVFRAFTDDCYLSLKPLSSISDEDAIEVARISMNKDSEWKPIEIVKWDWCWRVIINRELSLTDPSVNLEMIINIDFDVNENEISFEWNHIHIRGIGVEQRHLSSAISVYDYLRSKGYALPWMKLSVKEMVEAGWVKLKEVNNG